MAATSIPATPAAQALLGALADHPAATATELAAAAGLAHPDHPITIEVAGPLLVRVDPLAVSRILGNLLDNGAAHSPRGTPIVLSAGRDGVHAVLAIQDDGPGIPPVDRRLVPLVGKLVTHLRLGVALLGSLVTLIGEVVAAGRPLVLLVGGLFTVRGRSDR